MNETMARDPLVCWEDESCLEYPFIIGCIIGVVCLVGVGGNSLSFKVFQSISVKSSTIYLFQALAVIDNILLICMLPIFFFDKFLKYTGIFTSYFNCGYNFLVRMVFFPLSNISQLATVWVTVLVALNRYIAVCKPYQNNNLCSMKQTKILLTAVLVFSVVYNLPLYFESSVERVKFRDIKIEKFKYSNFTVPSEHLLPDNQTCFCLSFSHFYNQDFYFHGYYSISYMIFFLAIPLTILTILNSLLIIQLKKLRKRKAEMQSLRQQQDNNITLVLIIVVIVFIACQTPALVNRILWSVFDSDVRACPGFQFYFSKLSNMMISVNSAANFFIYLFFNMRLGLIEQLFYSHIRFSFDTTFLPLFRLPTKLTSIRFRQILSKSFCGRYFCCCVPGIKASNSFDVSHTYTVVPASVNKGKMMMMVEKQRQEQSVLTSLSQNHPPVVRKKPHALLEVKFRSNFGDVGNEYQGGNQDQPVVGNDIITENNNTVDDDHVNNNDNNNNNNNKKNLDDDVTSHVVAGAEDTIKGQSGCQEEDIHNDFVSSRNE